MDNCFIDIFVSLVIVINNIDSQFESTVIEAEKMLQSGYSNYEILCVNNSSQQSYDNVIDKLLKKVKHIRYLRLTQEVREEVALAAGMENAIGDIIVLSSQHNYSSCATKQAIELCRKGKDIIVGCSSSHKPLWYKISRFLFRTIFGHLVDYNVPKNDTRLRIISRRAANAVIATRNFHNHLFFRIANTGYGSHIFEYKLLQLQNQHRETFPQAFSRSISMLVFNSIKPLRIINFVGLIGSIMAIVFISYSILVRLWKSDVIEGWTTLILFMSIQFFLLFLILAFLGEYVVRLLVEREERNSYNVQSEKHSSVMIDIDRLNIKKQSKADIVNSVQTGRDR